jgi:hypothetical protein
VGAKNLPGSDGNFLFGAVGNYVTNGFFFSRGKLDEKTVFLCVILL